MNACTIIAKNYLAHARVLASTLLDHHPDASMTILVVDHDVSDVEVVGAKVVGLNDIRIPTEQLAQMIAMYDIQELATSVKPWLLETLLTESDHVIYLDPDIMVMSDLSQIPVLAKRHGIVLTPHVTQPMPRDGLRPSETDVNRSGIYNLGFLALGEHPDTRRFLAFWQERLAIDCITDLEGGLFVDQRWVDWAPGLYSHLIVRDTGWNAAYWNLVERPVKRCGPGPDDFVAGESQLRFLHLSGYSPHRPHLLSKHQGDAPRITLSSLPALRELTDRYGRALLANGYDEIIKTPTPFTHSRTGIRLDAAIRTAIRDEVLAGRRLPDPFSANDTLAEWLAEPIQVPSSGGLIVPRGIAVLWASRHDLSVGSDLATVDGHARARGWLNVSGRTELEWPGDLIDRMLEAFSGAPHGSWIDGKSVRSGGVNVVGYLSAELGVGEAARGVVSALEAAGIEVATWDYRGSMSRCAADWKDRGDRGAPFDTTILCINADMVPNFAREVGPDFFAGRRIIGLWFWEANEFPDRMREAFSYVDEVWVTSEYTANVLNQPSGGVPIREVPLPVRPIQLSQGARAAEGASPFRFLFMFDWLSVPERKNPWGLVTAYREAFPMVGDVELVIKTINGDKAINDVERLKYEVSDRTDIKLVDGYCSADERDSYFVDADCYVSLHRSEGYGLTMAEAMTAGIPVIATGYSGNLAFMTDDVALLVPATLASVPAGCGPYPEGSTWAEPDLAEAARLMRMVVADAELRARIGRAGRDHITSTRAPRPVGEKLADAVRLGGGTSRPKLALARELSPREKVERFVEHGPSRSWHGGRGPRRHVRRLIRRLLQPYLRRQREFEINVRDSLVHLEQRVDGQNSTVHGLVEQVEQQRAYVAEVERRVEPIERHVAAGPFMSSAFTAGSIDRFAAQGFGFTSEDLNQRSGPGSYLDFEERFRGSRELIKDRQKVYLEFLGPADRGRVIDIGAGRGEFVELASQAGYDVTGVDMDPSMVQAAQARGLNVVEAEAMEYLREVPDRSCSFVFCAQVVEHLTQHELEALALECRRVLRADGRLLLETVNPYSLQALRTFWVDLSHQKPIFPEVALELCRSAGFASAAAFFPSWPDVAWDQAAPESGEYAVLAGFEPISIGAGLLGSERVTEQVFKR